MQMRMQCLTDSRADDRYETERALIYPLWLPTHKHLDLKIEGARMASMAVQEPVFVYSLGANLGYWYGTRQQLVDEEIERGKPVEVIMTFMDGEPVNGLVAGRSPVGDHRDHLDRGE